MAKTFTVKARFVAEDRASPAIQKLIKRQEALSKGTENTAAKFKKGSISLKQYQEAVDRAEKEQRKLTKTIEAAGGTVEKSSGKFSSFAAGIKKNFLAITAAAASIVVAFNRIKKSAEEAGQSRAFANGLRAQGIAADEFIEKLRQVSDNQIANADLTLATNRAIALGIQADDIPALLDVAAQASIRLGVTVTKAFNDITTGVGRASPLILDNLGIVVDSVEIYKQFAASIGTSSENLTKQARTIALTEAVIKGADAAAGTFAQNQDQLAGAIGRAEAAMKNFNSAAGITGGITLFGLVRASLSVQLVMNQLATVIIATSQRILDLIRSVGFLQKAVSIIDGTINKLTGREKFFNKILKEQSHQLRLAARGLNDMRVEIDKNIVSAGEGLDAYLKLLKGIEGTGDAAGAAVPKLELIKQSEEDAAAAADDAADSFESLKNMLGLTAGAADDGVAPFNRQKNAIDALTASVIILTQAQQRRFNLSGGTGLTQAQQRRLRLSSRPGITGGPGVFTGFNVSGGTFTTVKNVTLDSNGNIIG